MANHKFLKLPLKRAAKSLVKGDPLLLPPSYCSRIRDNLQVPTPDQFLDSYKTETVSTLPCYSCSIHLELLNRTAISRKKLFKMKLNDIDSPICKYCHTNSNLTHSSVECVLPKSLKNYLLCMLA